MAYFIYNEKRVYYEEIGTGRPLILLHGNAASSNMFYGIKDHFPEYKVVLIDFLGHGQSDRLEEFPVDLWFDEGQQVIGLIKEQKYMHVNLIGCSGGALAAINAALEMPEAIDKVIADSFEGEVPISGFTENITAEREASKADEETRTFYGYMHGDDWEQVVDNDTRAISNHEKQIGRFFHKPLENFGAEILMTGCKTDEFAEAMGPDFFQRIYGELIRKIGHGQMYLFESGGHPALLSNTAEFLEVSSKFLKEEVK